MSDVSWNGTVHSMAEIFPLLPDDELNDLAADIAANGLQHPLVLDTDGTLIDGRNRMRACEIAGVEPRFTTLSSDTDVIAYILSANISRRHLTAGQRAIAVAMTLDRTQYRTGLAASLLNKLASKAYVSKATAVLKCDAEYGTDYAQQVLYGLPAHTEECEHADDEPCPNRPRSLEDAYKRAKAHDDERIKKMMLLVDLRTTDPELAKLVEAGTYSVETARAMMSARKREEARARKAAADIEEAYRQVQLALEETELPVIVTPELLERARQHEMPASNGQETIGDTFEQFEVPPPKTPPVDEAVERAKRHRAWTLAIFGMIGEDPVEYFRALPREDGFDRQMLLDALRQFMAWCAVAEAELTATEPRLEVVT